MTPPSSSTARASARIGRRWPSSSTRTRSGATAGWRRTSPVRATRGRRRRRRRNGAARERPSAASTSSSRRSRSCTTAPADSASRAARGCRSATSGARSLGGSRSSIGGMSPPIVWTPSPERIAAATITRYREWLNETRGLALADYADLWQWSVDELEDFWASIWEFFEVEAGEPYERVLTQREMPGGQWFPGARLSYAEHVFRRRADDE